MAKKKESQESNIEDVILEKYGEGILVECSAILEKPSIVIPVSPMIDTILGGGIPEGSFVILTGGPKNGKTTLALQYAANAQLIKFANKDFNPDGRNVYFYSIEGRLKPRDIMGIHGLDTAKLHIIQSKPGKILTAENFIDIAEKLINEKPGCVHIIDSFSALCSAEEFASDIGVQRRDNTPKLLATFCRRISNVIAVNKAIVIGITHQIANTSGMGHSAWIEASGQKIKYQADVKLRVGYSEKWTAGDTQIGQDNHWECQTSAIGPPGGKCVSKLRYGYGLDNELELAQLAVDLAIIEKGGAWYTIAQTKNDAFAGSKVQGLENLRRFYIDNAEEYEWLNNKIRTVLNICASEI